MPVTRLGGSGFSRPPYGSFAGKEEAAIVQVDAPAHRTLVVKADFRALMVSEDSRELIAKPDSRTLTIH